MAEKTSADVNFMNGNEEKLPTLNLAPGRTAYVEFLKAEAVKTEKMAKPAIVMTVKIRDDAETYALKSYEADPMDEKNIGLAPAGEIVEMWVVHTSLKIQLAEARPVPGEKIDITWTGIGKNQRGEKVFRFRTVFPERSLQDDAWDQFLQA